MTRTWRGNRKRWFSVHLDTHDFNEDDRNADNHVPTVPKLYTSTMLDILRPFTSLSENIPAKCHASRYDGEKKIQLPWCSLRLGIILYFDLLSNNFLSREIIIRHKQDDGTLSVNRKFLDFLNIFPRYIESESSYMTRSNFPVFRKNY